MAVPPTRLTRLLAASTDADARFRALVGAGCLTRAARSDGDGWRALVARLEEEEEGARAAGGPRPPGPSEVDRLAAALEGAGLLSRRGRRWAAESAPEP